MVEPDVKRFKPSSKVTSAASGSNLDSGPLRNVRLFILEAGIGKVRSDIFRSKLLALGGTLCSSISNDQPTHVLVDDGMTADRLLRILKPSDKSKFSEGLMFVRSQWLSSCIKMKTFVGESEHLLRLETSDIRVESAANIRPAQKTVEAPVLSGLAEKIFSDPTIGKDGISGGDSDYEASGDEETMEGQSGNSTAAGKKPLPKGNWVCAQSSSCPKVNHNQHVTDKLEALAKTYEAMNDKWRALSYQKAIMTLKKCDKEITSFEEAKSLPGIGARLAEKIWEIAESGELRKLNELMSQEDTKALELFTNVWGAGVQTAHAWIRQGFRTLDDLRAAEETLTRNQRIGLKYYDELLDRMLQEEAAQIEAVVKDAAQSLQPGLIAMACGSFRRGKLTCGDVDVLITHPDGHSHTGIFRKLIARLHEDGFLTDDLVSVDNGDQKKYLGVCKLPGEHTKHRRLDIIVVPYSEYACALMYFTGSAHFNRSMRNLAGRLNMSLNEHALCTGVVRRNGEKINHGVPLPTPTEESVFIHLGLTYRPPTERDH